MSLPTLPAHGGTYSAHGATLTLIELDYHRNGICGDGFYVARIHWEHDTAPVGEMLVVHFPNHDDDGERIDGGPIRTAVLSVDVLRRPEGATVEFGVNSWRPEILHEAIQHFIDGGAR